MEGATGRQRLNKSVLEKTLLPWPNYQEQENVVSVFLSIDDRIGVAQEKLSVYQSLFKTLLHELMSGERRVALK
jgi:type I restriction enzyme S subunit